MKLRVFVFSAMVIGLMASLFLLAYQPIARALSRSVILGEGEKCSPDAPKATEKENPNRIFFISCGGFL